MYAMILGLRFLIIRIRSLCCFAQVVLVGAVADNRAAAGIGSPGDYPQLSPTPSTLGWPMIFSAAGFCAVNGSAKASANIIMRSPFRLFRISCFLRVNSNGAVCKDA